MSPYKLFASGEVLTASDLQTYSVDQSVMTFATSADRTTALPTPSQGMVSFLSDSGTYWAYYELYNSQPGDDTAATQALRGSNWITQVAGNGDGYLTSATFAAANFTGPVGEQLYFWNHLRASGFLSGDPVLTTAVALPRNPFGGATIITSAPAYAMPANQNKICMNNVPGTAANALDLSLDDGFNATGTFRASDTVSSAVPGANVYYEGTYYTVCLRL
jgi:hypothetical protein